MDMRKLLLIAAAGLSLAACSAVDRPMDSEWQPTGPDTFRFVSPDPSAGNWWGEGYQDRWLEAWLADNHFCPGGYDITSRTFVKGGRMGSHDIWEGRCKA